MKTPLFLGFIFLIILNACTLQDQKTNTESPVISEKTLIITLTQRSIDISIATPTFTPEPTNIYHGDFIETKPIIPGEPLSLSKDIINLDNIRKVELLSTWGRGTFKDMEFSPKDQSLVVATGIGLWVYEINQFNQPHFIPTEYPVNNIHFSDDGEKIGSFGWRGPGGSNRPELGNC